MLFRPKLSLIASRKLVSLRKKWKKILNDKDNPFAALDEIEEDTVQNLVANLALLKVKKLVIKLMLILLVMISLILTSKLLQVMGN